MEPEILRKMLRNGRKILSALEIRGATLSYSRVKTAPLVDTFSESFELEASRKGAESLQ